MTRRPVLILGADGFIGRHIAFALRADGREVIASARRVSALQQMGFDTLQADLVDPRWHRPEAWRAALPGPVDVVNCAGLLSASEAHFAAVHRDAPAALYEALDPEAWVVLISAIGIDMGQTPFARWRQVGEEALGARGTILRPGLVVADTSYGGTSLARSLAVLPGAVPVIGAGAQQVNPLHANDLAAIVLHCLQTRASGVPFAVGGPESLSAAEYTQSLRRWFGLPPGRLIHLPVSLTRVLGRIGDALRLGPVSATTVDQLVSGVHAPLDPRLETAPQPRAWSQILAGRPAGTQDLWHARLYGMRPSLRIVLALMWLISGLIGLFLAPEAFVPSLGGHLPEGLVIGLARLGGLVDLAIALALLRNWRPALTGLAQLAMVGGYSLGLTVLAPALWLLPYGGLLKNLPVILLILVWIVLERER